MKHTFQFGSAMVRAFTLIKLLAIIAMLPMPSLAAILDLSLRGTWSPTNSGLIQSVAVKNGHAYCALREGGLAVIDVRKPGNPEQVGSVEGWAQGAVFLGNHAFVTQELGELEVFDISQPANPQRVVHLNLSEWFPERPSLGLYGMKASPPSQLCIGFEYVLRDDDGVRNIEAVMIIDVSNPLVPQLVSVLPGYGRAVVVGHYALLAGGPTKEKPGLDRNVYFFDLVDSVHPRLVSTYAPEDLEAVVRDVAVVGTLAWVWSDTGLHIVDFSDPAQPKRVDAAFLNGSTVLGVREAGGLAYVRTLSPAGLAVFDLANPAAPRKLGGYTTAGAATDLAVFDRFVFLVGDFGLQIIETRWRPSPAYTALYVFGDSWNATSGGPYWQGRWSNGPMWPEVLSTNLGFAFLRTNNFAAGFATLSDVVSTQVPRLRSIPEPDHSLFVIWAGGNDVFAAGAHTTSALRSDTIWNNLIRQMVKNATNAVKTLYTKGARSIAVVDLDDLNNITDVNLNTQDAAQLRSRIADYNVALHVAMDHMDQAYPDLRLFRMNFHDRWDSLVQQYADYGFLRADLGALNDRTLTDKSYAGPGRDYVFWYGAHPTSRTHTIWAGWFLDLAANQRLERLELGQELNGLTVHLNKLRVGRDYVLQTSENLTDWLDALEFPSAVGTNLWHESATAKSSRFFRLKWQN